MIYMWFVSKLDCVDLPQMCNGIKENGGINGSSYLRSVPVSGGEGEKVRSDQTLCVCVFSVSSVCVMCVSDFSAKAEWPPTVTGYRWRSNRSGW